MTLSLMSPTGRISGSQEFRGKDIVSIREFFVTTLRGKMNGGGFAVIKYIVCDLAAGQLYDELQAAKKSHKVK